MYFNTDQTKDEIEYRWIYDTNTKIKSDINAIC